MNDLKDKVVYITGGSSGIGYGIAKVLLNKGMRIAISSRSQSRAIDSAKRLSHDKTKIIGIKSDVSKYEDEKKAVNEIIKKFGQLDIVIANAGVGHFAPVNKLSIEQWHQMINTNLNGVFHTLKASFEFLKNSEGYYITLASLAGTHFFENGTGYNASKFGVVGFSQAAMLDLRKHNIKVSTIMPGSVSSQFNNHIPSDEDNWKIQPEDIGNLIYDLLKMPHRILPSKIEIRPTKTSFQK